MPRAYLRLQHHLGTRWRAFHNGLAAAGFEISEREFRGGPDDVLVIWNRMQRDEGAAERFQQGGGRVIVAENGYIGRSHDGATLVALARDYHNGAGTWPIGDAARWRLHNIELERWRRDGKAILILPQRGFGSPGVAMPHTWLTRVTGRLQRMTDRPLKVRAHPGNRSSGREPDFRDAWAAVTWGSGAGLKAIAAGVPVFHDFPRWIGSPAARPLAGADLEQPFLGDRVPMFERLCWAQWSELEIATGRPFRELLAL